MKAFVPALSLLLLVTTAQAETAYDSFGPNESFNSNINLAIGGGLSQAFLFTSTASGSIQELRLAIGGYTGSPIPLTLKFYSNVNLGAYQDRIGQALGTLSGNANGSGPAVVSIDPKGVDVNLTQGESYWIEASSGPQLYWSITGLSNPPVVASALTRNGSTTYQFARFGPAFSIGVGPAVQATPEPVTIGLGLAAFGVALRRRRKA